MMVGLIIGNLRTSPSFSGRKSDAKTSCLKRSVPTIISLMSSSELEGFFDLAALTSPQDVEALVIGRRPKSSQLRTLSLMKARGSGRNSRYQRHPDGSGALTWGRTTTPRFCRLSDHRLGPCSRRLPYWRASAEAPPSIFAR